jgi:hypothetical protein
MLGIIYQPGPIQWSMLAGCPRDRLARWYMIHGTMVPARRSRTYQYNITAVSHNLSTNMLQLTVGPRGYPEVMNPGISLSGPGMSVE